MPKLNAIAKSAIEEVLDKEDNKSQEAFKEGYQEENLALQIFNAYNEGNKIKCENSTPCSICRDRKKQGKTGGIRAHFHGSDFNACALRVYNDCMKGISIEDDLDKNHALLNDGHLHEEHIIKSLDWSGLRVIAARNAEEFERQCKFQVYGHEDQDFLIVGHFDGLMCREADDLKDVYDVLLECKAVKEYTWNKLKELGPKGISEEWYGQIQFYLYMLTLKVAYLIVKHRHTSEILLPLQILLNTPFINKRLLKLNEVWCKLVYNEGNIQKEREEDSSSCKFCPYKQDCWGG